MLIDELLKIIDTYLPLRTAIEGDKIGLQIQSGKTEVYNILITLEITEKVINEALNNKIDCIITFHPLIYNPLDNITDSNRVGFLTTKLIQNSIAVISVHTTFDAYIEGTSKILSDSLGLDFSSFLVDNPDIQGCGIGAISYSKEPLKAIDFIENIQNICFSPIKYCSGKSEYIKKIGIVAGSGSNFIGTAIEKNCDAYICSDITYHKFHLAKGRIWLIDVGHYEMEQFVPLGLFRLLKTKLKGLDIDSFIMSKTITNPINYYPNNDYIHKQQEFLLNINDKW